MKVNLGMVSAAAAEQERADRLRDAAPELLAALEEMVKCHDRLMALVREVHGELADCSYIVNARALLARLRSEPTPDPVHTARCRCETCNPSEPRDVGGGSAPRYYAELTAESIGLSNWCSECVDRHASGTESCPLTRPTAPTAEPTR